MPLQLRFRTLILRIPVNSALKITRSALDSTDLGQKEFELRKLINILHEAELDTKFKKGLV